MEGTLQAILILGTLLFLAIILYNLVKHKLDLKYTLIWLLFGLCLLILSIFPQVAYSVAVWIGVISPVNAIFLFAYLFSLLILLSLTAIVSQQSKRIKQLAQKTALLENRLHQLEK